MAHDRVERDIRRGRLALDGRAQAQVKAQRHQRALGVVAHGGVGRVLVLAVVLDPGVKAGLGHRLHLPPRRLHHLVDGFVEQLEVARVVQQAAAAQQQVVVVAGEAFKKPEQFGVVFACVVVARQLARAQALDVPGVKVLVADESAQRGVTVGYFFVAKAWQVTPVADQRGRVAVLQPAVAVINGIEHEQVIFKGRFLTAVPKPDLRFANFLGVRQQLIAVKTGRSTGHHKAVRHAAGLEAAAPESAHLHRRIHQRVVTVCVVSAKARLAHLVRRQTRGQ